MMNKPMVKVALVSVALISSAVSAGGLLGKVPVSLPTNALEQVKFSTLVSKFDADKNGMLSMSELTDSENEYLHSAFAKVDTNKDKGINEKEFNAFMALVNKSKNMLTQ